MYHFAWPAFTVNAMSHRAFLIQTKAEASEYEEMDNVFNVSGFFIITLIDFSSRIALEGTEGDKV